MEEVCWLIKYISISKLVFLVTMFILWILMHQQSLLTIMETFQTLIPLFPYDLFSISFACFGDMHSYPVK